MKQGTLTVIMKLELGSAAELEAVRAALKRIDRAPGFFEGVPRLHFARWAILGHDPDADRPASLDDVYLAFGADFESDRPRPRELLAGFVGQLVDALVERRARTGEDAFDDIHRRCEGYPAGGLNDPQAVKAYLLDHHVRAGARHIAFAYRANTVENLRQAVAMRAEVDRRLDAFPASSARGVERMYRELRQEMRARYPRLFNAESRKNREAAYRAALWATLCYAPFDLLASVVEFFQRLYRRARRRLATLLPLRGRHPRRTAGRRLPELAPGLPSTVQSPLVLVNDLKDGWQSRILLKLLLPILNLRFQRYLEGLNHIATIHFARWVLFRTREGRSRLLFFSNFDGSWDSYIDSFLDNPDVRLFLVKIWSHTRNFPGIEDPEVFKAWLEARQVKTVDVWYSAYRDCGEQSTVDLHNAFRLELVFEHNDNSPEVQGFLATGLGTSAMRPLSFGRALSGLLVNPAPGLAAAPNERGRTHHVASKAGGFGGRAREAADALQAP